MSRVLKLSTVLPASQEKIYKAWLSSREHGAFTGGKAKIEAKVGGRFNVWDGYIEGVTLQLEPYGRIIQAWRTTEFPENSPDSRLEVLFEPVEGGTRLTLIHSEIPEGQENDYEQGWNEYYFEPMKEYFNH